MGYLLFNIYALLKKTLEKGHFGQGKKDFLTSTQLKRGKIQKIQGNFPPIPLYIWYRLESSSAES